MANASPGSPAFSSVSVPVAYLGTGVQLVSPANLPYAALGTVAIGGVVATGNTVTTTINGTASTATAAVSDTATILATKLAAAINANASVLVTASASGSVVTITSTVTGTAGYYSLSTSATGGGATATASFTYLELPGIVFPTKGFSYATPGGSGAVAFYVGTPSFVDAATKADLRGQGLV